MKIRRAVLADAPLFESCARKLYEEAVAVTHDPLLSPRAEGFVANWAAWFQLHLDRQTGLALFAENPEPVGVIAAYVSPPMYGADVFPLVGVIGLWWVDPKQRCQGIGAQLLQQAEAWLRDNGMPYVETHYMSAAHSAEALWKQNGYAPYFIAARKSLAE